ncbi:hypothetical protein [Pseudomonas sp. dw_358]|uniref:hypothetical protein n=1 Tax=Pseudomonas sp. dw_358 TaxID=2720083 RepID=UPI001BD46893|nr:hypothetical protein [Pseudomonas sp. dw_358]
MELTLTILMLVGAWLLVAAAMLWGVLRVARRRQRAGLRDTRRIHSHTPEFSDEPL